MVLTFALITPGVLQNGKSISSSGKMKVNESQIEQIIDRALAEDLGIGDITTASLIHGDQKGIGVITIKREGILAGVEVAKQVFHRVDPNLKVDILLEDGSRVKPGDIAARVKGNVTSILKAERVALNFLQRLSGIASDTDYYVKAVADLPVDIMDTRKTTPGLRGLEKYAVRVGGGENHRINLGDGILIKDNHLAILRRQGLNMKEILARARQSASQQLKVEVEVRTVPEALEAAEAGADIIMLDNMSLEDISKAVESVRRRALIEASGGISLDNVRAVAETGVDFISIGALTHSARALDIGLELEAK